MSRLCGQRGPRGPNKSHRTEAQRRQSRLDRAQREARMTEERGIQITLTKFAMFPVMRGPEVRFCCDDYPECWHNRRPAALCQG